MGNFERKIDAIDYYFDRAGDSRLFTLSGTRDFKGKDILCFDVRKLKNGYGGKWGGGKWSRIYYDIKMLYEHDGSLSSLVKSSKIQVKDSFLDAERRFSAHTRAISAAKMNVDEVPLRDVIPADIMDEYMLLRCTAIYQLWLPLKDQVIENYEQRVWPVYCDVSRIEESYIKVDVPFIDSCLKRSDLAGHELSFLRSTKNLADVNGFVKTLIDPFGSKTARLRHGGGFYAMGIPHGVCRQALVSRFGGLGQILSIDFNAIDYRSLVKAVNDPKLNEMYAGSFDFHTTTAKVLGSDVTPERRDHVKKITYTHLYGGDLNTLQRQTSLPMAQLQPMVEKLDEVFKPISVFRRELTEKSKKDGYLITPGGHRVEVGKDDHEGKIVGLFAQTYSSSIFNKAIKIAFEAMDNWELAGPEGVKSKFIFTVHDEADFDIHPDEYALVARIARKMEQETGFIVKFKMGKNYAEATAK